MTVATLGALGKLVSGAVCGQAELCIEDALPLQDVIPGPYITLIDKPRLLDSVARSGAAAAVVPNGFPSIDLPTIQVANPHAAFEQIIAYFRPAIIERHQGVHVNAQIESSATVGAGCVIRPGASVGAGSVIGARSILHPGAHVMANCVVGEDCELYPGVVLYPDTRIGDRCTIHGGTILGAFGFGYRTIHGRHERTAQVGWVELGDDVELGACVTVDRGTYGATRIGTGSKLDNQVMVGHNCHIGKYNLICAQTGIAGSSTTGDYVVLAGQVGIRDHIHLADRVVVAAQSGVIQDIPAGEVWSGTPAQPTKKYMQSVAAVSRLPEMRGELRQLEQECRRMQQQMLEIREYLEQEPRGQSILKAQSGAAVNESQLPERKVA